MSVVVTIALGILTVAAAFALARVVQRGVSIADRVIATEILLLIVVMSIAAAAVRTRSETFLDVLVVVSLLAFVGSVTVARFIERRGL
jgi:multicomponent Na+:H+ antiporter subunit F